MALVGLSVLSPYIRLSSVRGGSVSVSLGLRPEREELELSRATFSILLCGREE